DISCGGQSSKASVLSACWVATRCPAHWGILSRLSRDVQGGSRMSCTDERVELLKKLWSDGLSASQIAAELGGITRNAVIGKVHRLGLSGRAKSTSSAAPRQRKARAPSHMMRIG